MEVTIKIINLCDHEVNIKDMTGKILKLEPCEGNPARVQSNYTPAFYLGTIGVSRKASTVTTDLPNPTPGTMYVVSKIVAENNKDRRDLLFPGFQYTMASGLRYCICLETF